MHCKKSALLALSRLILKSSLTASATISTYLTGVSYSSSGWVPQTPGHFRISGTGLDGYILQNLEHIYGKIKYLTIHTQTHTCLTAVCQGLPRSVDTRKVKPAWILLKQETVSGSGISWAICKSAHRSRQMTTPESHHSVFTGRKQNSYDEDRQVTAWQCET